MTWFSKALILLLSIVIHIITIGHVFSFGFLVNVFQNTFTIDFTNGTLTGTNQSTLVEVTSIGTVQLGLTMGLQFLTIFAFNSATPILGSNSFVELFLFIGVGSWFGGVFGGSYVVNYAQLIGIYGVFTGIGTALLYWTSLTLVMTLQGVENWKYFITAIVVTAGAVGQILYALIFAPLYTTDEIIWWDGNSHQLWRVTFRWLGIIGGGILLLCTLGITMARRLDCVDSTITPVETIKNEKELIYDTQLSNFVACGGCPNYKRVDSALTSAFWIFVFSSFFNNAAIYTPIVQYVEYLKSIGLTSFETQLNLVWVAVGSAVGRIIPGIIICKSNLTPYVYIFSQLWLLITIGCWLVVTDYIGATVFSVFFGIGAGLCITSTLQLLLSFSSGEFTTTRLWPVGRNATPLLMVPITLIGMTLGAVGAGTVFGAIYQAAGGDDDETVGYRIAIICTIAMQAAGTLLAIMVPIVLSCTKKPKE